jgi:putative redox protein
MISAKVELTQPLRQQRQFVAQTGSGHHLLLDDAAGGTGPKPIELVAAGLAGCTAFDVITVLRQKYHQKITGYEVRVEADQADRPPQVFTTVRIHHVVTGYGIDVAALEEAIRLSEEKYCSVGAMVKKNGNLSHHLRDRRTQNRVDQPDPDCRSPELRNKLRTKLSTKSSTRLKFVLAAVAVLGLWKAAPAQPPTEPPALTLQQAVKIALEKNPAAQGGARGHEGSVRRRSRSAIGLPAAADVLRDCDARKRPGLRVWQRAATTALHVCRFRAEQAEHPVALRKLQYTFWQGFSFLCRWHSGTG